MIKKITKTSWNTRKIIKKIACYAISGIYFYALKTPNVIPKTKDIKPTDQITRLAYSN